MLRRLLILALIMAGLAMIPIASTGTASAAPSGLPTGFRTVAYDAGMFQYDLTNFVVVPSTQSMVATGKSGRITRVDIAGDGLDPSDASPTIIAQVPTYYQGDRGVLGISLASDYLASGHLYLLWDYCQGQASNDQQCIPDGGTPTGRLSQFTVTGPTSKPTGIDLTSEVILMDGLPSWSPTPGQTCTDSHTIGTVLTAPNGTLFVGNGDGSGYCGAADPSALSAQDVTSPRGKIFHINPNGSPTSDDIVGSYQGKVWAYGFRNPFRFSYSNGVLMVGDVGWNTWEEQNVVHAGENFGWPCLEGADATTTGFFSSPVCQANKSSFVSAFILWSHFESGRPAQSAAVGGVFAPTSWPTPYNGAYIFGDYARGDLFASDHNTPFGTLGSWGGITSIQNGLFSDVYVTDIGAAGPGKITRIHFDNPTNSPPTVAIQGAPLVGKAPLHVQWTTPQAADADGTVTAWTWDFGDGSSVQTGTGLPPAIDHVYTTPGQYKAVLTVTDNGGSSASATETVQVGNNPPILTVVQPPPGTTYHIGDPIHVQAATSDSDGDAVTLQYQPVIHHCPTPSDCHVHPSAFQSSPDFIFPNHGDDSPDYYLEIVVQATDSRGAVSTASVNYVLAPVVGQPPPPVPAPTPPPPPAPSPAQGLKFNPQPPQATWGLRYLSRSTW
jgi:glucose/arabinose dehydrogenase/PKD repeat protein